MSLKRHTLKKLGSRSFHPYIQTDYSEPQLELITPVAQSTTEARRFLGAITDVAIRSMDKSEYLWPLSMPPVIVEEEIQIAQFGKWLRSINTELVWQNATGKFAPVHIWNSL